MNNWNGIGSKLWIAYGLVWIDRIGQEGVETLNRVGLLLPQNKVLVILYFQYGFILYIIWSDRET